MYKNLVLVDGEIMPAEEAAVSVHDRGHQFGDGVFEIVPVYNGRCFALLPHMDNLFESVIKVKIPAVYTIEELIEFHEALIAESGIENGEIYTQITRGTADYGLAFPEMSVPQLTMTIVETDREVLAAKRESGVNIITTEDNRWQFCNVNTLNRLPEVLARQKARESNAFDTLFIREIFRRFLRSRHRPYFSRGGSRRSHRLCEGRGSDRHRHSQLQHKAAGFR